MANLNATIINTILDFISNHKLFTSYDVGNEVKEKFPEATYWEIRDYVRKCYHTDMSPLGYMKTICHPTIDNKTREAVIYHPIPEYYSHWELETEYEDQQMIANKIKEKSAANREWQFASPPKNNCQNPNDWESFGAAIGDNTILYPMDK